VLSGPLSASRQLRASPNPASGLYGYALQQLTVALVIMMGSLVAPFMEEAAFRGYFQVALEREFRGVVAVAF
jgi:membrane protease YdiL (CAAX protease family)